eukprot:CAMPEP_0115220180 /NCGR_PEP_ID=MMETSP0270-20121206/27312_1 /TAXON_ID=71861 /ORGANISM="Scrippsiella trochoidea, Strain CCMP3099" /LENGTH=354 /DNA_ID=CAMNT_0002634223 /DNA_START=54 /DNA_END=1114 /DNA_ORIENTATION=-
MPRQSRCLSEDAFSLHWAEFEQVVSAEDFPECLPVHMSLQTFSDLVKDARMEDLLKILKIHKQPEQEASTPPSCYSSSRLMNDKVECYRVIIVLRSGRPFARDILRMTFRHAPELAQSEWTCWLVQDFFNVFQLGDPDLNALVHKLEPHIAEFLRSPHANFVLRKMVATLLPDMLDFIIRTIEKEGVVKNAKHQYASRVVEDVIVRFIKLGMEDRLANVLDEIIGAALEMSMDVHGNYIIQDMMTICSTHHRGAIMKNLRGHWTQLASRFFVVQALLSSSQGKVKKGLRNELDLAVGQLTLVERALANGTAEDLRDCAIDVSNFEEASPRRPAPPIAAAAKAPEFSGGGGGGGG